MYYDDFLFWGFIGKVERESLNFSRKGLRFYFFIYVQFSILYNGNNVVEVYVFSDSNYVVDIIEDVEIDVQFIYFVIWNVIFVEFVNRMSRYLRVFLLLFIQ